MMYDKGFIIFGRNFAKLIIDIYSFTVFIFTYQK